MKQLASIIVAAITIAICIAMDSRLRADEPPVGAPPCQDTYVVPETLGGAEAREILFDESPRANGHIIPAVLTRRYGPVREPAPQFYALKDNGAPGFDWSSGFGWWPWGGWRIGLPNFGFGLPGFGFAGFRFSFPGFANSYFPGYRFSFVGYNDAYRPWYTYPSSQIRGDRLPWYSPGGAGPNIYQPWYTQRNSLPWYSPFGIGPNIYTPSYSWRAYYPWYAPNGPGPNIYTPSWQYGGCLYW
jgi:hypothetical protein